MKRVTKDELLEKEESLYTLIRIASNLFNSHPIFDKLINKATNVINDCNAIINNNAEYIALGGRAVIQYDMNMNKLMEFDSISKAAKAVHTAPSSIKKVCDGGFYRNGKHVNMKQTKGYIFKYKE
jgi:NUMOD1 domain.